MSVKVRFARIALVILAWAVSVYAMPPARYTYQGRLTDSGGAPLTGSHILYFSLFEGGSAETAESGTLLFRESAMINVQQGVAGHAIGTGANLFGGPLDHETLKTSTDTYVQVAVDSEENVVLPRTRLETVPYASVAANGDARIPLDGPLPITISEPGSYYLTRNLKQTDPGGSGIAITTSSVALDLNGFVLAGPGMNSAISRNGITLVGSPRPEGVVVRNGFVEQWSNFGVQMTGGIHFRNRVQNITASHNGSGASTGGISAGGLVDIEDCKAFHNGTFGIFCNNGVIRNCFASLNSGSGIVSSGGVIRDCMSTQNGLVGFQIGNGSMSDCQASGNSDAGVNVGNRSILERVVAYGNGASGIGGSAFIVRECVFRDCVASSNTLEGIRTDDSCIVENCLARDNDGAGISVKGRCRVTGSLASINAVGILVRDEGGSAIENNSAIANFGNEIDVAPGTRVVGNHVSGSLLSIGSGAGIVAGEKSHVEGNTAQHNSIGIQTLGPCLAIGNKASGNTQNYSLATGTNGPVVSSVNIATNTNPAANYSY